MHGTIPMAVKIKQSNSYKVDSFMSLAYIKCSVNLFFLREETAVCVGSCNKTGRMDI